MRQAFRYLDGGRTLSTGSGSDKTLSWVMCAGRYFQNIESTDSAKGVKSFMDRIKTTVRSMPACWRS